MFNDLKKDWVYLLMNEWMDYWMDECINKWVKNTKVIQVMNKVSNL